MASCKRQGGLRAARTAGALALAAVLGGCASLPSLEGRPDSRAIVATVENSALARALAGSAAKLVHGTGILPLPDGPDALAARLRLAGEAQVGIDVQSYIWRGDLSGTLLLKALHDAAGRGVRVRLLLDDNGTHLDETLAALDAHPNIEVRLYNPFTLRRAPWLNFLTDFTRLNRRMHNKAFTVDGQATIVGGRNIGDEYFDAGQDALFIDLDVLVVGKVVGDVAADFDRYWASASAYPISRLVDAPAEHAIERLEAKAAQALAQPAAAGYVEALRRNRLITDLQQGRLDFEWTTARLVSDDPAKTLGKDKAAQGPGLLPLLKAKLGAPARDLEIVSPYFVPTAAGTQALAELARQGIQVHVLTNSLAATDVFAVHAGYAKRRQALLEAGVNLHEIKPSAHNVRSASDHGPVGSSSASLHAKTFAVDGQRIFVGSLNFDPRSVLFNTEMGLVIDSPRLAGRLSALFLQGLAPHAWRLELDRDGRIAWCSPDGAARAGAASAPGGSPTCATREPEASLLRRVGVTLLSWLPVEPLL